MKIYKRGDRAFLGTLPRSYGHMQCWRHTIDEGGKSSGSPTAVQPPRSNTAGQTNRFAFTIVLGMQLGMQLSAR